MLPPQCASPRRHFTPTPIPLPTGAMPPGSDALPPHRSALPPTRHARRDTPAFYHRFSSSGFSPPQLARLERCFVASKMVSGPLRGPGSDPRTSNPTPPPPCHLLRSPCAWLHGLSTPALSLVSRSHAIVSSQWERHRMAMRRQPMAIAPDTAAVSVAIEMYDRGFR